MPQAKHVATCQSVGECATVNPGGGVGAVNPSDQRLQFTEHLAELPQESRSVLCGRLTLLKPRAGDDAGTQLFGAARRIRAQRKSLSKLHRHQYDQRRSPPPPNYVDQQEKKEQEGRYAGCGMCGHAPLPEGVLRLENGLPNARRRYRASLNPGVAAPFEPGQAPGSPFTMGGLPKRPGGHQPLNCNRSDARIAANP
ncbi:hypothetical protein Pen02_83440 [Plantactinospora endophytica]|uniref:Uncharacterized protein n=1 Tax=Plantactinospora endophytica TaxID=673535 RepID=A0ABQ4EFB2_9ACTN|nr:hypothetical protein Pen02_83440 [Plantactinospora endophytica]